MDDISNPGSAKITKGNPKSGGSGCKGICIRYKAKKPKEGGRYRAGQRRCQICEVFFQTDDTWCICCGYRLRSKPRNAKYKAMLRSGQEANRKESEKST